MKIAVIMCTYKRLHLLPKTLEMLDNQTDLEFSLYIWNNAKDENVREITEKESHKYYISVMNSQNNIGGLGRFHMAGMLSNDKRYEYVIFVDDDQIFDENFIKDFRSEARKDTISGWWAFKLGKKYWDKIRAKPGESADYIGTGGMICPIDTFQDSELIEKIPEKYKFIEDLWLSFYLKYEKGFTLKRSKVNLEFQEGESIRDQFHELKSLKEEFYEYLLKKYNKDRATENLKLLVIMPLYNRVAYVEQAIESILQQTYTNFELIIVDDCSTDNSLEIVKKYEKNDKVVVLENKENRGCYYSRNKALDYAKELGWDIFTIHDPDDVSDLSRFEKILNFFKNPDILGVVPTYIEADANLNYIKVNDKMTYQGEGQAFYRRTVFENILGYYDNIRFSGDTDYLWRLLAYKEHSREVFEVRNSYEPMYIRRQHGKNLTKLYDFENDRRPYFNKIREDINTNMIPTGNYYREKFD